MDSATDATPGPVLAHGMDAELVLPDWPPLTLGEVRALAPRYAALDGPLRLVWHSPRPFSAAARVHTARGEVFIKRHDARVRDVAALQEEHGFIAHLRAQRFGVPQVLANREQASATGIGNRTYELHLPATGTDAYRDVHSWVPAHSVADARSLGAALARLHRAAQGYAAPPRPARPLLAGIDIVAADDLGRAFAETLAARPALAAFVAQVAGEQPFLDTVQALHERLRPLLPALEPLWVHNDWHASNLFWSAGVPRSVTAAIDFGLCNRGWAVADLATALERNTIAWLEPGEDRGRLPLALGLLEGYCAVRPLSAAERQALPLVLPLAHVEYALSEVDYFRGILANDANAHLAWSMFLLGHVQWFAGPHGQQYLAALGAALDAVPALAPAGDRGAKG